MMGIKLQGMVVPYSANKRQDISVRERSLCALLSVEMD
jgi:hypothetical protein